MKVIDNFLDDFEFKKLANTILKDRFPWYFNDYKGVINDGNFQFTHVFFREGKISSNFSKIVLPLLKKLDAKSVLRVKANLTPQKKKNIKSAMHIDTGIENSKTAILYCNTNNGSTLFQNGKKVFSKENRAVIFDGHQKHCGIDCTDQKIRVVINFNYFLK